eukprot:COSAG01_NODE_741_length_13888_cov_119.430996_12_plen_78_part_00
MVCFTTWSRYITSDSDSCACIYSPHHYAPDKVPRSILLICSPYMAQLHCPLDYRERGQMLLLLHQLCASAALSTVLR